MMTDTDAVVDGRPDATQADLPELPDGWTVTTHTPSHISFFHAAGDGEATDTGYRRSIALTNTPNAAADRWSVRGLAGYAPPPRLAEAVPFDDALEAVLEEIQAVNAGSPTEGTATDLPRRDSGETTTDAGEDSTAGADGGRDETIAQTSLTDKLDLTECPGRADGVNHARFRTTSG